MGWGLANRQIELEKQIFTRAESTADKNKSMNQSIEQSTRKQIEMRKTAT